MKPLPLTLSGLALATIVAFVVKDGPPPAEALAPRQQASLPSPFQPPSKAATPVAAADRGFTWGQTAAPAKKPVPPLTRLIATIEPPSRPVWETVMEYRRALAPTKEQDAEVLGALSFCKGAEMRASLAQKFRAGGSPPESYSGVAGTSDRDAALCSRLGPGDYAIRLDIAQRYAQAGDDEGKLLYFDVGPGGGVPPSSLSEEQRKVWVAQATTYLEQAAAAGNLKAIQRLERRYEGDAAVEETGVEPVLDADPTKAFTYSLVFWTRVLKQRTDLDPATRRSIEAGVQLKEKQLTPAEARSGREAAQQLLAKL